MNSQDLYDKVKSKLKVRLVDLLERTPEAQQGGPHHRKQLEEQLQGWIRGLPEEVRLQQLPTEQQQRLIEETINEVVGYDVLDRLFTDPSITEIMVNGPSQIYIERNGIIERFDARFRDENHLLSVIERMLESVHLTVNEANPICDASFPDGSRVNIIIPPLTLNGPVMTIRRKLRDWTMEDYTSLNVLSERAAEFLQGCVKAKVNMVISGGSSSGKTTLVSILARAIPLGSRIITIENVAELELTGQEHWIRLVAKGANVENKGEIPLRVLVKNALRMRPDRIILGEARGGEALDVVQAMHSGHEGVITVLHSNSARAALERLETLMLMSGLDLAPAACRKQIAGSVDLVIHCGRFVDGSRRVATISQVLDVSSDGFELEDLFVFEVEGFDSDAKLQGSCRYTGAKPKFLPKFQMTNVPIAPWLTA